jgi:hypothetical protein
MTMLPRLQPALTWYYLAEGQPKGPIEVGELERLFGWPVNDTNSRY